MKGLLASALILFAASSIAATLNPVQSLNPIGSTSGQAIISTGPSTPPSWGTISATALTGIVPVVNGGTGVTTAAAELSRIGAAPTLSPAFTGVPTAPNAAAGTNTSQIATTAFVLGTMGAPPGIGSGTPNTGAFTTLSASGTVSGSGFTTLLSPYAPLASPVFTGSVTPGNGIVGGTTAKGTGLVGEFISSGPTASGTLTSGTPVSITSISLTPGIWDIQGTVQFTPAGTTVPSVLIASISSVTNTLGSAEKTNQQINSAFPAGNIQIASTPTVRVVVTGTTTYYLVVQANFTTSTLTTTYYLRATRI